MGLSFLSGAFALVATLAYLVMASFGFTTAQAVTSSLLLLSLLLLGAVFLCLFLVEFCKISADRYMAEIRRAEKSAFLKDCRR